MTKRSRGTLICFVTALVLFLVLNAVMVAPYLLAVLMGGLLAVTTRPLYEKLRSKNWGPKTSGLTVVTLTLVVVIAPLTLMVVKAADQAIEMGKTIVANQSFSTNQLIDAAMKVPGVKTVVGDGQALQKQVGQWVQKGAEAGSASLLGFLGSLPEYLLQVTLAILAMFFLLVDGRKFVGWLKEEFPLDPEVRESLFGSVRFTAVSTVVATLLAALAQSVIMFVSFLVLGVPQAFLAAGATFIFAWIPILGSVPVAFAGIVYLWMKGMIGKAILMVVFTSIVGIIDNLIRALVFKGKSDMHPLVSLVSIFGGISFFGIWGVFAGPLITAILLSLLDVWPGVAKHYGIIDGPGPLTLDTTTPSTEILAQPMQKQRPSGGILSHV